ncbi:NADH-quinone oxidoreductase subunit A [Desulfovibrio sp. TH_2024_36128]
MATMVHTTAGQEYLAVLLLIIITLLFGLITLFVGRFFRMSRPYPEKLVAYESGNEPTAEPRTRFSIKFYYVAILFVIIDVEAIYLYTWAVEFVRLGSLGMVEMFTFMALLVLGYLYAWKKGAFQWVK